ncbi:(d)CMP kinase [Geobacter sp. SVR]|uniref:(d)CMP kinase n=1 Tax=Geobacter sp. SVR TaxID=2495594 RepID=UPI00143EF4BE|nr:(d)CMP kinase [Geobacter sp. SVR]BCS54466.1 cytidylate kinase [Geobacter sp. SVR]GCF87065.1 cytidylate kinase [Geobacter sp. SVR]
MKSGLVIAIDGPSGAGKSTIAGLLAQRLGYLQIDTGAMYRAVALLISRAGIDPSDVAAVERLCSNVDVRLEVVDGVQRVTANGQDVTGQIRTPEMSLMTSRVSALRPVREAMVRAQRVMGCNGRVVLEGRDIGTVVFPDADLKFFLSASPEERGRRRFTELLAKGEQVTLEDTIAEVILRDEQDSRRDLAPLRQAEDAIAIDSSGLAIEDVLSTMEGFVKQKL